MLNPAGTKHIEKGTTARIEADERAQGVIRAPILQGENRVFTPGKSKTGPENAVINKKDKSISRTNQRRGIVYIKKNNIIKNIKPADDDYLDIVPDEMDQLHGENSDLGKNKHIMTIEPGF